MFRNRYKLSKISQSKSKGDLFFERKSIPKWKRRPCSESVAGNICSCDCCKLDAATCSQSTVETSKYRRRKRAYLKERRVVKSGHENLVSLRGALWCGISRRKHTAGGGRGVPRKNTIILDWMSFLLCDYLCNFSPRTAFAKKRERWLKGKRGSKTYWENLFLS